MKKTGKGAALLLGALIIAASFFYSVPAKAETDDVGNYALNAEVDASEYYKDDTYDLNPNNAVDGNLETRWASKNECASAWFSIKLESAQSVNNLIVKESAVNKQNIAEIVLEYKTEESQDWMAVSNVETERSGNVMSMFFESVTAQYFKITFYSIDPQPGLNIDEIEIRNQVRPESSVEADVEMEGFPAANLQDKNLETLWKADSASAQVTLNFTPEMTVNTITIHEDQSEGRIASIKVEIWNGSDWQMAAETECSRLPSKKISFLIPVLYPGCD